jgi:hypothetical protein
VKLKWILIVVIAVLAAGGLVVAYRGGSKERVQEAAGDKPVVAESRVKRTANGETTIDLDPESQKRLGLKTTALDAVQFHPEIKAYGRVLDPAALATAAADLVSARAAANASQAELARLKTLVAQSNASAQALQTAEATASRDAAQAEAARTQLVAAWGKVIAGRDDLPKFIESLAGGETALVRVDLLAGDALNSSPESARLFAVSDPDHPVEARFLSVAPTIDPQSQGRGFLFLVTTNAPSFLPGASVTAYLPQPGEPLSGVEIPRDAVVRFNGRAWVYAQTGAETFTRREIDSSRPRPNGWFVMQRVRPGDRIVTDGAQLLFSEEQKYQIQMGD